MLAVGYPVRGLLKNYSCKREKVTAVTQNSKKGSCRIAEQMARRSLALVLIVAPLGLDRQLAPNGVQRPAFSGSGSGAGRSFTCLPT
jgi:hypothetical protein